MAQSLVPIVSTLHLRDSSTIETRPILGLRKEEVKNLNVDNNDNAAILPAMSSTRTMRPSARNGLSRAAVSAFLALWCVFALASGDARAHCLDLGGDCSPSATVPEGPCHDQAPDSGTNSNCNSCVDILVHADASASGIRPDHELRAPAAAPSFGFASEALLAAGDGSTAAVTSLFGSRSPQPFLRTAVLRI